jgi:rhodanese-related sulfurtransferase
MKALLLVPMSAFLLSSCGTFRGSHDSLRIINAPNGLTTVRTPHDGRIEITSSGIYSIKRSRSDIPILVECPNGKRSQGVIETGINPGVIVLDIVVFFPSVIIDVLNDKSYDVETLSLNQFCGM